MPRLPDRIAIGVLTTTFPPELVDRVIAKTGRGEQRQRLLPARVVVYYTLAMCLFAQAGYEEVMRLLVEGLAWARRWRGSWQVPDKSSIARARARLGPAPLRELFAEVARPLATSATKGAWYRDWRLVALDGTTLVLLVDQGLASLELWHTFQATGAELVWRCRQDVKLPVLEVFDDGSWRSELGSGHPRSRRVAVRVVDYRLDDPGRTGEQDGYRLITTIGDPAQAPAAELAALYPQRWELETALDELKTHQRGPGVVLRSKHPDGVCQEVWAHLLVHYAIRTDLVALGVGQGPPLGRVLVAD
jgi:hypothetical protein